MKANLIEKWIGLQPLFVYAILMAEFIPYRLFNLLRNARVTIIGLTHYERANIQDLVGK